MENDSFRCVRAGTSPNAVRSMPHLHKGQTQNVAIDRRRTVVGRKEKGPERGETTLQIERWFQGSAVCDDYRTRPHVEASFHLYEEAPFGGPIAQCLFTQATVDRLTAEDRQRLADVVLRLFPSRTTCQRCDQSAISRLIHANNNAATTREDIDKILKTFTEEEEARRA